MPSYRTDRTAEDMKRHLSEIFRELKDPRISMLLSVIRVEVSGDLSSAKIFVSAIEGTEKTAESIKGLNSAKGYIKRELSVRVKMRKMPDLKFIADNSIEHGAQIAKILDDFSDEKKEAEENED